MCGHTPVAQDHSWATASAPTTWRTLPSSGGNGHRGPGNGHRSEFGVCTTTRDLFYRAHGGECLRPSGVVACQVSVRKAMNRRVARIRAEVDAPQPIWYSKVLGCPRVQHPVGDAVQARVMVTMTTAAPNALGRGRRAAFDDRSAGGRIQVRRRLVGDEIGSIANARGRRRCFSPPRQHRGDAPPGRLVPGCREVCRPRQRVDLAHPGVAAGRRRSRRRVSDCSRL